MSKNTVTMRLEDYEELRDSANQLQHLKEGGVVVRRYGHKKECLVVAEKIPEEIKKDMEMIERFDTIEHENEILKKTVREKDAVIGILKKKAEEDIQKLNGRFMKISPWQFLKWKRNMRLYGREITD